MEISIKLTPKMEEWLRKRTEGAIRQMAESGYDFRDWTLELEATTILRVKMEEEENVRGIRG